MANPILHGHSLQPAVDKLILENKTSREISNYCKENGLNVSHVLIARYTKEQKDVIRIEVDKRVKEIRHAAVTEQVATQVFLQTIIDKAYQDMQDGKLEISLKLALDAARILMPAKIQADITTTLSMEDVIATLNQEADSTEVGEDDADN